MCARYGLVDPISLSNRFLLPSEARPLAPRYNAAPTQRMPVVVDGGNQNRLEVMRWGLVPVWADDLKIGSRMINARSETVAEKPAFKGPLRRQRCLVPGSHFFEWGQTEQGRMPFLVSLRDEDIFAFAGIYDVNTKATGEEVRSFAILTTAPNELMAPIHDRMPVILERSDEAAWLDREASVDDLQKLCKPYPADQMQARIISRLVNRPANDTPAVMA